MALRPAAGLSGFARRVVTLTTRCDDGVGTNIAGLHGTLLLHADGSYTYQSTANNITADTTDVFVYTLKDGDGDLSTTTLTINLANATVLAPTDNDVTVNENALDTTVTGPTWQPGRLRQPRHRESGGDGCDQPAQRFGRVRHADLCAGERRQRGDGGHLRHDPGPMPTAAMSTR